MFGAVGWGAKESRKDKPININRIIAQMCVRVSALSVLFLVCLFCFLLLVCCWVFGFVCLLLLFFLWGFLFVVICWFVVYCWFVVVAAAFVIIFFNY